LALMFVDAEALTRTLVDCLGGYWSVEPKKKKVRLAVGLRILAFAMLYSDEKESIFYSSTSVLSYHTY